MAMKSKRISEKEFLKDEVKRLADNYASLDRLYTQSLKVQKEHRDTIARLDSRCQTQMNSMAELVGQKEELVLQLKDQDKKIQTLEHDVDLLCRSTIGASQTIIELLQ
jgi:uncharacterized protein Yka (UPF0111/DUF47 family)